MPIATASFGTTPTTCPPTRSEIPVDDDQIADEAPRSLAEGSGAAEGVWVVNELGETIVRIDPEKNEVAVDFQVDSPTAVAADDSRHLGDERGEGPRLSP